MSPRGSSPLPIPGRPAAVLATATASLAILLVAGCLSGPAQTPVPLPLPAEQSPLLGIQLAPGTPHPWQGTTLTYSSANELRCAPANCEVTRFHLDPPPGAWMLQVGLDWAPSHAGSTGDLDLYYPSFNLTVRGPEGFTAFHSGMKFGTSVLLRDPPAGDYEAEVRITHNLRDWVLPFIAGPTPVDPVPTQATGSYTGVLLLAPAPAPVPGPLLPDLLVRNLDGLRLEYAPPGEGHSYSPEAPMPGTKGCAVGEFQETGATRCLRFSIAIGNDGEGPLTLSSLRSSDPAEAQRQEAGMASEEAVQCVVDDTGNGTRRAAGSATYSPSHRHMHFDNILHYGLHEFDVASGMRGELVATGTKLGYGPWPEALVHDGRQLAAGPIVEDPCGLPWLAGLGQGWYDYYLWWRTSQFIDVAGVPDGVYELETTINPELNILESDASNNSGSVVLRLTGDRVEVLRAFLFTA